MDKATLKKWLIGDFTLRRILRSLLSVALSVYTCIIAYGYFAADRMIFPAHPSSYQDDATILKLETRPGVFISALHLTNPDAKFTILYSHGNAEDLGEITPDLKQFAARGFSVLAYDYQGYGTSDGSPSERNACQDILTAYQYLRTRQKLPADRIIAWGRSVGGGPTLDLATRHPVAGLVIESAFTTAFRVVTHIPITPFDKFRNIGKIRKANCPVLVMHGQEDRIIPYWHGRALFDRANEPKLSLWVPGAGHDDMMDIASPTYWKMLDELVPLIEKSQTFP
jgi:pimeloyl-ACP methyl ester carboxylesterase